MLPPIACKSATAASLINRVATATEHSAEPALSIGVLGRHDDPSVHNIAAAVQARGGVAHLIDLSNVTQGPDGALLHNGTAFPKLDLAIAYHGAELPHNGMKHMRVLENSGTAFLNTPDSIEHSRDKWLSGDLFQWAGVRTPRTELAMSGDEAKMLAAKVGGPSDDIIAKVRVGTEGKGVMKLERNSVGPVVDALEALKKDINSHGTEVVEPGTVIQALVKMKTPADVRAVVIDGKVVESEDGTEAAMERVVGASKDGDFRTNLSNGGTAVPYKLHPRDRETAERAVSALGLHAGGVDLMGEKGSMVAVEANSGFGQKIKGITGVPVDDHIAKLAMRLASDARATTSTK